jgi:8-oxo-dGTP diphosphatase
MLPGVSAVVRNDAGEVLLARRSDTGAWSIPAGVIDPGEQPATAVLREVFEETGVHAEIERLAGAATHPVTYPNGDRCEFFNVWFLCRAVGGEARVGDDESTEVGWFKPDALPPVAGWVALRIESALGSASAWYAQPGTVHEALTDPKAL